MILMEILSLLLVDNYRGMNAMIKWMNFFQFSFFQM